MRYQWPSLLVVIGIQIVYELLGDRTRSGFPGLSGPFLAVLGPPSSSEKSLKLLDLARESGTFSVVDSGSRGRFNSPHLLRDLRIGLPCRRMTRSPSPSAIMHPPTVKVHKTGFVWPKCSNSRMQFNRVVCHLPLALAVGLRKRPAGVYAYGRWIS